MGDAMILRRGGTGGEPVRLLTVSSAAALPNTAQDNTLALVTTQTPGAVQLSHTAPAAPAAGDVWIMTSVSGDHLLQVGRKNLLNTCLVRGYQYLGGAWTVKDLYLRSGGAWRNMYTYLYSRGAEFVTALGLSSMLGDTSSQISMQPDYFDAIMLATANNWKGCWWEAMDYTPFVTLRLIISTPAATLSLGYGDARYVPADAPLSYTVLFENLPAATLLWGLYALSEARNGRQVDLDEAARDLLLPETLLQLGGKAGVGRGLVRLLVTEV